MSDTVKPPIDEPVVAKPDDYDPEDEDAVFASETPAKAEVDPEDDPELADTDDASDDASDDEDDL